MGEEGKPPVEGEEGKPPVEGEGAPPAGEGAKPESLTMTQAELDAMINARITKSKANWEAEAKAKAERDKMDEVERLKAEKADAEKAAAEGLKGANARLVKTEARLQAVAAGVKPDRVAVFLRNVDLDGVGVGDDGEVDEAAVKAAVDKALQLVPEFKGAAAPPAGASGGEHQGGTQKVWTREEVGKLTPEEFEKHEAAIMAQTRAGTLT